MENNPYAAPATEPSSIALSDLAQLPFERVKKNYYRSCNLQCITALQIIGILFIAGFGVMIGTGGRSVLSEPLSPLYLGFLGASCLLGIFTVVGLIKRPHWGRIVAIISCILSLFSIPIGTLIGIVGLVALFGSPELFGPDRHKHGELKREFKRRKAEEKAAKRAAKQS